MSMKNYVAKISPASLGLGLSVLILPFVFQNCGQAGLDGNSDFSSTTTSAEQKKFDAAPFPFDVSMNQFSVTSCPKASAGALNPEAVDVPVYTVRGGAYDNRLLAKRYPFAFSEAQALSEDDKAFRLNAGIGISKKYSSYIKDSFKERIAAKPDKDLELKTLIRKAVQSKHKYNLVGAFITQTRGRGVPFSFNNEDLISPMFASTGADNTLNQILASTFRDSTGYDRINYLAAASEITERAMVASMGFTKTEVRRDEIIGRQITSDSQFQFGFTKSDGGESVTDLLSPTENNSKELYGKGYRFQTTASWVGKKDLVYDKYGTPSYQDDSRLSTFLSGVAEVDTSTGGAAGNVMTDQNWSCFSLMVVRDIDRTYPGTQIYFNPDPQLVAGTLGQVLNPLWTEGTLGVTPAVKNKYYDYVIGTTVVRGVKTACPPQNIGSGGQPGSLNYDGRARDSDPNPNPIPNNEWTRARLNLEVARRFLNSSDWEINTNPEYMCAVPKRATASSSCYASGDTDSTKYIRYAPVITNDTANGCGPGQNECASYIHICYRRN